MPFDQPTRNLLQRTVSRCRDILAGRWDSPAEGEFFKQLQEIYGISPDGTAAPLEVLEHLSDEDLETARVLREILEHYASGLIATGKKPAEARREAVLRLAREQAFTVLNRLAALRMAEERGIVLECVRQGLQSEGFQLFQQSAGTALGSTPAAYRTYLFVLFDELSLDLGVLFNRFDKSSLLFPRHAALEAILRELNGTGSANKDAAFTPAQISTLWAEDEAIGWIYQYYNDQAERKAMRDESAAPRNSRELAVRNQFFTPRYVVEFLTDNTLGRIWYEMTKGRTKLKEQCRYLVRRPTEIFLNPGEDAPSAPENSKSSTQNSKSQEELLREPVHIPHRPLKDPRSILMLDPACGSMHFGLYAFDLFEVIYEEFWDLHAADPENFKLNPENSRADSLFSLYATKGDFLRDVPRLIIENNLHGIDIDPRCAQIAGLSLWLRAQKAWQRLGLSPAQRPAIKRSNIVCAEPMPGEKELLREFVEREFPAAERAVCLRLLEAIFDKMQLAGEAGSLLKIEEEIRSAIEDARDAWQKLATKPPELFTTTELNQLSTAPELTGLDQAVSSLTTDPRHLTTDFWERIEERIYAALRDYAEQAENGGGFQRRLFAEDAARGFAFIDVCRKRYDVALMNPPFGESSARVNAYLKSEFELGRPDAYMCFIFRASRILAPRGKCGAITSRTFLTLQFFESLRELLLEGSLRLESLLDLGGGVLDGATVETCAYVSEVLEKDNLILFLNFPRHAVVDELTDTILALQRGVLPEDSYIKHSTAIARMPGKVFAYRMVASVLHAFASGRPLDVQFCMQRTAFADEKTSDFSVRQGLIPGDQFRFSRLWQEVPAAASGWCWAAKGGDYSRYISREDLLLAWKNDGAEIKAFAEEHYGGASRTIKNEHLFFKPGISFPRVSSVGLNARVLPSNFAFTDTGMAVIPRRKEDCLPLLGFLNSRLADYCCNSLHPGRKFEIAHLSSLPIAPDVLTSVELARIVSESADIVRRLFSLQEDKVEFLLPEKLQQGINQGEAGSSSPFVRSSSALARLAVLQAALNKLVFSIYDIPQAEQVEILRDLQDGTSASEFAEHLSGLTKAFLLPEAVSASDCDDVDLMSAEHGTTSFLLGCAFGRWDIRYATGEQAAPELPDPFAPLPVCPPGQLQNAQGLPARPEDVPAAYPVRIPWDGILVDDPNHPLDIERRVREVIEIIWSGQPGGPTAETIEHEACEILGVKSLRDYFRKPAGFFADHLKRYSKSRRQAPIYWPLSTASGSYTLWIYYHRLTPDTLYKCLQQFVEPKIREIEQDLVRLRAMDEAGEGGRQTRDQLAKAEPLRTELLALRDELAHWAPRWKPNLNDGVQITASPLWKLFLLPKWRKTLEQTWKELDRGDYDWAHLAHTLNPARVREKCKTDRSLAIAHSLEDLCQIQAPAPKKKRGKKVKTTISKDLS